MLENFNFGLMSASKTELAYYYVFHGQNLLQQADSCEIKALTHDEWQKKTGTSESELYYFGSYKSLSCYVVPVSEKIRIRDYEWLDM